MADGLPRSGPTSVACCRWSPPRRGGPPARGRAHELAADPAHRVRHGRGAHRRSRSSTSPRPQDSRTHLGRLAAKVLHADNGGVSTVLRRKVEANIGILTSSVWTWVIPMRRPVPVVPRLAAARLAASGGGAGARTAGRARRRARRRHRRLRAQRLGHRRAGDDAGRGPAVRRLPDPARRPTDEPRRRPGRRARRRQHRVAAVDAAGWRCRRSCARTYRGALCRPPAASPIIVADPRGRGVARCGVDDAGPARILTVLVVLRVRRSRPPRRRARQRRRRPRVQGSCAGARAGPADHRRVKLVCGYAVAVIGCALVDADGRVGDAARRRRAGRAAAPTSATSSTAHPDAR